MTPLSKQLRIDNLLFNDGVETSIFSLGIQRIAECEALEKPHPYSPIPLTPELLERFGFEDVSSEFTRFTLGKFILVETSGKFVYGYFSEDIECKIEYVHQLQNLYFALTGNELILKP